MTLFDLTLRTRSSLAVDGEPSDLISEYTGEVIGEDEDSGEAVAGYVRAQVLHAGLAANRGEPLFEVCDCHSHELHLLHTLLYQPDGYELKPRLADRFDAFASDLLILDYILLDPKWRKLRLGLLVARKMIDLLGGGCGLVVSQISPLRRAAHRDLGVPAKWIPAPRSEAAKKAAPVRLRGYFRQMGFERLGRTPYYVLSTTQRTPGGEELLNPRVAGGR